MHENGPRIEMLSGGKSRPGGREERNYPDQSNSYSNISSVTS
jgi:hypothetical protein